MKYRKVILILLSYLRAKITINMPQRVIKLRENVLEAIKSDNVLKNKIAIALEKSYPTIQRYLNQNSKNLTLESTLMVLRKELKLTNEELLEG